MGYECNHGVAKVAIVVAVAVAKQIIVLELLVTELFHPIVASSLYHGCSNILFYK